MHNWPCCLDHLHAVIFRDLTWFGFFLFFPTPSSFTHLSAQPSPPPKKALAPHFLCSVLHVSVLSWDRKQRKSFSSEDTHVDARRHRSRPLIKTTTVCGRAPVMIIEPLPAPTPSHAGQSPPYCLTHYSFTKFAKLLRVTACTSYQSCKTALRTISFTSVK